MKKVISLLLALVLSLSLCACGDNDTSEITVEDEATASIENTAISHPLVQDLCGQWHTAPEGAPFQSLVINEDGTCVVDGIDAVWQMEDFYTKDDALSIYIYIDGEACHGMLYFSDTDAAAVTEPTGDFPVFIPYEAHKD